MTDLTKASTLLGLENRTGLLDGLITPRDCVVVPSQANVSGIFHSDNARLAYIKDRSQSAERGSSEELENISDNCQRENAYSLPACKWSR